MKRRLAVLSVVWCGCRGGDAGTHLAPIVPGAVVDRVILTGALHPTNAADLLVPETDESSLVIRWMATDGAVVKAGDRVFELDDAPFTGKLHEDHVRLATAEAQFRLSQASDATQLAGMKFAVREAEIARAKAKLQADLPAELLTARAAQEHQWALAEAEQDLRKAEQKLTAQAAQLGLEQRLRQIDLDGTRRAIGLAERAIGSLVVRAPRDGVVVIGTRPSGHRYRAGDTVQQGEVIATQPDLTKPMEVRADLIDVDDGRVTAAMPGTCTLDAYPDAPIACAVARLAPIARPKQGRSAIRRAFEVTLELAHGEPGRLRPGMSVKVELPTGDRGSVGDAVAVSIVGGAR